MGQKIEWMVEMQGLREGLKENFLFRDLKEEGLTLLEEGAAYLSCEKGMILSEEKEFYKNLVVVLSGRIQIYQRQKEKTILLNTIEQGQCFGVTTLFGPQEDFITRIRVEREAQLLFVSQELLTQLFAKDLDFTLKYISFLTNRIRFFNGKIDTFTGKSATARLALYLLQQGEAKKSQEFAFNFKQMASQLDMGRASLYRGMDELLAAGLIEKKGRKILIADEEKLREFLEEKEG